MSDLLFSSHRRSFRHGALLTTVSALALALAAPQGALAASLGARNAALSAPGIASSAATTAAQQAAAIAKQSTNALLRATQALQAMQAVQNAARGLALAGPNNLGPDPNHPGLQLPNVPNGLNTAGLVPDSGLQAPGQSSTVTSWVNANTPTQTTSNAQTTVTTVQTGPYALLNWTTFNIGKNTTLVFDQTTNSNGNGANWVALNKINDPSGVPSQILGAVKAAGSVYLINQNGIIFGGSSQINVHTLIASSLQIANPANFLGGAGIVSNTSSFGGGAGSGTVTVQAGAQISTPRGDAVLLAPNVSNNGTISAPSGQALLVGGTDVALGTGDSYLRGFILATDTADRAGSVVNNGLISASHGNVTIVGGTVQQNGVVLSTTSTTANGSIIIQASNNQNTTQSLLPTSQQTVQMTTSSNQLLLAPGSVTQILPDVTDQSRITDTQQIANSSILLIGGTIDIEGLVQLRGYDTMNPVTFPTTSLLIAGMSIVATAGSTSSPGVLLGTQAVLDASGTSDAVASASRDSVAVELRSNELRDSPVVRSGPLYQQTIYVNALASGTNADGTIWRGTPLADASAWIALTARSLDERMMSGAPIAINGGITRATNGTIPPARTQVIAEPGSEIYVNGGYTTYAPGFVQVSTLITAEGRRVSASNANPNVDYIGICCSFTVDHSHWGVKEVFGVRSGYYDPGFLQGGAGGSLSIYASNAILAGSVTAVTLIGGNQRTLAAEPAASAFKLDDVGNPPANAVGPLGLVPLTYGGGNTSLEISSTASGAITSDTIVLPPSWLNSGFGTISIGADNTILLKAGNDLALPAGASFTATANTVRVGGSISTPAGNITLTGAFTAASTAPQANPNGTYSFRSGNVQLDATGALRAAGLWTSDLGVQGQSSAPIAFNGGNITLASYGDINLAPGSIIDVSGGGYQSSAGKIVGVGNGGNLALTSGLVVPSSNYASAALGYVSFDGGQLLAGQWSGFGFAGTKGGTLSLTTSAVATIQPASLMADSTLLSQPSSNSLDISTSFFSQGGFARINVTTSGLAVPGDVTLAPTVSTMVLTSPSAPSGTAIAAIARPRLLPQGARPAASISLRARGDLIDSINRVDLSSYSLNVAQGAIVTTDPGGGITLTGDQLAVVAGTVSAPGGSISLAGGNYKISNANVPSLLSGEGVWLTSTGILSAAGTVTSRMQSNGATFQDVLPGGTVTVSSANSAFDTGSYVILMPGSLIDVSGITGASTLPAAGSFAPRSAFGRTGTITTVSSSAGSISITAVDGALLEGTLSGHAGGAGAAGGTLNVSLGLHAADQIGNISGTWPQVEPTYVVLQQAQSSIVASGNLRPGSDAGVADARIPLSADMIMAGGLDSVALTPGTALQLASGVSLHLSNQLTVNAQTIIVPDSGTEMLSVNYLSWQNLLALGATGAAGGTGSLTIRANNVDLVGNLTLQGAQTTRFIVTGDIRLTGVVPTAGATSLPQLAGALASSGELAFAAGQVYPTTDTGFTLASQTEIAFAANGAPPVAPLSAGGVLNVYAPDIEQFGTIRAPNGIVALGSAAATTVDGMTIPATTTLVLGAGSLTSVAGGGQIVPYGFTQGGHWLYGAAAGASLLVAAPPAKQVLLNGTNISEAAGAVIDASGGGDLYAKEFVPGTGGSKDIFAGANVYAVLPGYSGITPYDPRYSIGGPVVGENIYLNGAPGLPAGFYTLLPGQYALLPGAFRVTLQSTAVTIGSAAITGVTLPDGSAITSGYMQTPGTGTNSEHWSLFEVMSGPVARRYSEIKDSFANGFFTAQAAAKGTAIPRLPRDAGQLSIAATGNLIINGSGVFKPGPGGLGGLADISANQILVVDSGAVVDVQQFAPSGNPDAWNPIVLGAGNLSRLGVESLLLGGSRSFDSAGVHITATATQVVVANDAADPLVLPDIELIATPAITTVPFTISSGGVAASLPLPIGGTGQIIITPTAVLRAQGSVAPGGPTTIIIGNPQTAVGPVPNSVTAGDPYAAVYENAGFPGAAVDTYYAAAASNQAAYVRLSGAGLVSVKGTGATYAGVPMNPIAVIGTSSTSNITVGDALVGTTQTFVIPPTMPLNSGLVSGQTITFADPNNPANSVLATVSGTYSPGSPTVQVTIVAVGSGKGTPGSWTVNSTAAIDLGNLFVTLPTATNSNGTSATSIRLGTGLIGTTQMLATQAGLVLQPGFAAKPGLPGYAGELISLCDANNPKNYVIGRVSAYNPLTGALAVTVTKEVGSGTVANWNLSAFNVGGSISVAPGAQLTASNSLTLNASGNNQVPAGVRLSAKAVELASGTISLGDIGSAVLPGLVLNQAALYSLASVSALKLVSPNEIDLYGSLSLGQSDPVSGQPTLRNLTFDSAGLVAKVPGTSTFTAEQVTFQNSLGGSVATTAPIAGAGLIINASDLLGTDPSGTATGYNNAKISFGIGAVALAGFGDGVALKSSGEIVAVGDGGSLNVRSALTLDAPEITAGSMTLPQPFTTQIVTFNTAAYTIAATDSLTAPSVYYPVTLTNSSGASPLPPALLGDSLTITGGATTIATNVALPGGAFILTANGGDINVQSGGIIDVSGRAIPFRDVLATVGGGSISLASTNGKLTIDAGARLDVSDLADAGALNATSAGKLSLSAPIGGVTLAGTLSGAGVTKDNSGSFVLDTKSLDGPSSTYDSLAQMLVGGGFGKSWEIRARSGNITMNGQTPARSVTVSADVGNIDFGGTIDASGATGGRINIWAGKDLTIESTAVFDAHGTIADANGRGGQVWLAADAAGNGTGMLRLKVGAQIDVGADQPNSGGSGPVLGGTLTLSTARNAAGNNVNLSVTGGTLANFLSGVKGESVWDGVVVVGNQVYSSTTATLTLTPTLFQSTYLADAAAFMANESAIQSILGAGAGTGIAIVNGASVLINVRPGIAIGNNGDILISGDSLNPVGIDLSGTNNTASPLYNNDQAALIGHFGQYDEPVVLTIRATGNLSFGTFNAATSVLTLGSLSDGFSEHAGGLSGIFTGAGASAAAAVFDPPVSTTSYNRLSGGLGADSATFFLTAGADLAAADPVRTSSSATNGTLTVAGTTGGTAATDDPLFVYNAQLHGGRAPATFVDLASLVRTGTGNIAVSTAEDLVLQSPLSVIYTAGTGYNVNGTSTQPLTGFSQYSGVLSLGFRQTADKLPSATFPSNGGNVDLVIGHNLVGAMNTANTLPGLSYNAQGLPYAMTALGSQLRLQGSGPTIGLINGDSFVGLGSFNDLYATTGPAGFNQLAWYTWFPYLENTVGAFGGGNVSVKAGGNVSNVQFVVPTNARDAGSQFTTAAYNGISQTGLYVQGGGNVSVRAGGNITEVYTYVQNGKTSLQAGGAATHLMFETGTGDISVQAGREIGVSDQNLNPYFLLDGKGFDVSGIAFTQNANVLGALPIGRTNILGQTVQGYTSTPTGSVTLNAVGSITLNVGLPGAGIQSTAQNVPFVAVTAAWETGQGILPPQLHLVSLQGDITNNASFITYPSQNGTVDLLARGSVTLNKGFVVSDAEASIMPTLANIASVLASYTTPGAFLTPQYAQLKTIGSLSAGILVGGVNYLAGQDFSFTALGGDTFAQTLRSGTAVVDPVVVAQRHGCVAANGACQPLHANDNNPIRIFALNGDVAQIQSGDPTSGSIGFLENLPKPASVYAGRDVRDLALLGQNNNPTDVTSIVAGRDVIYPPAIGPDGSLQTVPGGTQLLSPAAIQIGGPGNLLIQSGRNTDLGTSSGIATFGNLLDPSLPSPGAGITIETGLGGTLPDYAGFITEYVNPATVAGNQFAEPLQLFDAQGNVIGSGAQAYAYLQTLSPDGQGILLNRIFFGLLRDSGREHTGAASSANYEQGSTVIDTAGKLNSAFVNYERAFAVIPALLNRTSGSGSFLGGLSTVRTRAGGNITVISPHGEIQVGLATLPAGFQGYSDPKDPTYALGFGIVTEKGGDVDLYADGDVSVNQSRVFTLDGGDMTVVSRNGNIDAGKGAKTVQAIQPPSISYDVYGNVTLTPYGPSSGSGLAVLRAFPTTPLGNADLIAFTGVVNAGDAGVRVSGNINIAAVAVLNAGNIQVGGTASGVPTVVAPNTNALTATNNAAGAAAKTDTPAGSPANDQPSIIIVEFLGFGGGGGDQPVNQDDLHRRQGGNEDQRSQNPDSAYQVLGAGNITAEEARQLLVERRQGPRR